MNIILLGPPGAGKGTQAARLAGDARHGPAVDRRHAARSGARPARRSALKAKAVMDAGELVCDAIVTALIGERLDSRSASKGAIFDGFPRTAAQAEALDAAARRARPQARPCHRARGRRGRAGRAHHRPLHLRQVRRRLSRHASSSPRSRASATSAARPSSSAAPTTMSETVRTRMAEYRAKTAPILPYLRSARAGPPRRRHGRYRTMYGDRGDPGQGTRWLSPGTQSPKRKGRGRPRLSFARFRLHRVTDQCLERRFASGAA